MVKVLIYDTMKHHFNFSEYPGIDYSTPKDLASSETEQQNVEIVKSLEDRLRDFELKLSACYARLRIEVKAAGDSSREQMENTISAKERQKENQAAEMPQTLRINTSTISKVNLFRKLRESGYNAICSTPSQIVKDGGSYDAESCILLDEEFENLVVVPASMYGSLKASHFVGNAWLISQDKASMYGLEHASSLINEGMHVIDARAGCGTKVMYLSELVGISGHVFAFENRPGRIETLKANLKRCDINS